MSNVFVKSTATEKFIQFGEGGFLRGFADWMIQKMTDAGVFEGSVVVDKIVSSGKIGYGFDAYNERYVDMMEVGIVDPTKVTRFALQNAASVASMILTTEALVADKPEPVAPVAPAAPGGMY